MAYSTSSPPQLLVPSIGDRPAIWAYESADADSTVNGASYFSNGVTLGMKVGDIVFIFDTATPLVSLAFVTSVSGNAATTAFGAVA